MPTLINTGPSPRGFHRLESYLTCPMRYYWRNVAGIPRGVPADPLVRGTLGHVLMAHHYARQVCRERGVSEDAFYPPEIAAGMVSHEYGEAGSRLLSKAIAAFYRYRQVYIVEALTVIGIEKLLETQIAGYRYTARADMIVRDPTGRVWIYDHKYVGRIDDRTFQRYTLSGQFLGLHHLGRAAYGAAFAGCIINAVGVDDGKCERRQVAISPWALQRFPGVVCAAEEGIAAMEASRQPPAHMAVSELACFTAYGRCEFYDACRWGQADP